MNFFKTHKINKYYKLKNNKKWILIFVIILLLILIITSLIITSLISKNQVNNKSTLSQNLFSQSLSEKNLENSENFKNYLVGPEYIFQNPVKESMSALTDDYFSSVVFIGDSVTSGIQLYKTAKEAVVISKTGLNINNIINNNIIYNNQEMTVLEAIKQSGRKNIYIMIGSNGIGWLDDDEMISLYIDWLKELRNQIPDSVIYVQSVLPITKTLSDINSKKSDALTNEKIEIYNNKLLKSCVENKFYYLDISEKFKDENNALPEDASPVDGMHINASYYNIWLDYIKSHVIK
ncbi:MAG: hypothetical protein J6C55_02135 [Oscillospiraceae bacterium]|nr:hypothetical protein [Oscillospiraceae bacterium]